jgi:hypothetical protein
MRTLTAGEAAAVVGWAAALEAHEGCAPLDVPAGPSRRGRRRRHASLALRRAAVARLADLLCP